MPGPDANAYFFDDAMFATGDSPQGKWTGRALTRYDVSKVADVRNLTCRQAYQVQCLLRLRVFRPPEFGIAKTDQYQWSDYPAALISALEPKLVNCKGTIELVHYSPKTVNTSVNTDVGLINSTDAGLTRQHTYGSSMSVTNSFGINLGLDAEGDPTGGGSFEHSQMTERRNERMVSANRSASLQLSASASMTIKDWGAYASLRPAASDKHPNIVTWVFAQEYPWDALLLRPEAAGQDVPQIPSDVTARLFGPTAVTPPSHLSQLGLDFVCRATWLITPVWTAGKEPSLSVTLDGELWQGTHSIQKPTKSRRERPAANPLQPANSSGKITISYVPFSGAGKAAKRGKSTHEAVAQPISHTITLEQLALQPITQTGTANGAVLTFAPAEFHYFPPGGPFAITTKSNRLYATGSGFSQHGNDLLAAVPAQAPGVVPPSFVLFFKVLDLDKGYDLVLKHWLIKSQNPVELSICVNPPAKSDGSPDLGSPQAVRYVGEYEGDGGDNNVTAIALRDLSFGTADYHDYLQLGLNIIHVTLSAKVPQGYVLRAVAIG